MFLFWKTYTVLDGGLSLFSIPHPPLLFLSSVGKRKTNSFSKVSFRHRFISLANGIVDPLLFMVPFLIWIGVQSKSRRFPTVGVLSISYQVLIRVLRAGANGETIFKGLRGVKKPSLINFPLHLDLCHISQC